MKSLTRILAILAFVLGGAAARLQAEAVKFDGNSNAASFGVLLSDGATPKMLRLDSSGYLYVISPAGTAGPAKAEDAAHVTADMGYAVWAVRSDTPTAKGADNDYGPLLVDASGRLWTNIGAMPADATELPAAGAFADNTANPTAPAVGSFEHLWDGATWDRSPGDSTNGQFVNIKAIAAGLDIDVKTPGAPGTVDAEVTGIAADTDIEAATANLRILGFSALSTAGAVGILRHDTVGATCDGPVVAYLSLAAATPMNVSFGPRGLAIPNGLCVDRTSGTIEFSAHLVTEATP